MEIIGYLILIALYITFFAFVVGVLLVSIGAGHFIGVFLGTFNAFKNYFTSIGEKISNKTMRAISFVVLFLVAIAGVIALALFMFRTFSR